MTKTLVAAILLLPIQAWAGDTSMYDTEAEFLADLETLAGRCSALEDGEVVDEIFGIKLVRTGEKCTLGPGEIDPMAVKYFDRNQIDWAGIQGTDMLWVRHK